MEFSDNELKNILSSLKHFDFFLRYFFPSLYLDFKEYRDLQAKIQKYLDEKEEKKESDK